VTRAEAIALALVCGDERSDAQCVLALTVVALVLATTGALG